MSTVSYNQVIVKLKKVFVYLVGFCFDYYATVYRVSQRNWHSVLYVNNFIIVR